VDSGKSSGRNAPLEGRRGSFGSGDAAQAATAAAIAALAAAQVTGSADPGPAAGGGACAAKQKHLSSADEVWLSR